MNVVFVEQAPLMLQRVFLFQTSTSVQRMEARVTKTRSVLIMMDRTLAFAKLASREMEPFVLVNHSIMQLFV